MAKRKTVNGIRLNKEVTERIRQQLRRADDTLEEAHKRGLLDTKYYEENYKKIQRLTLVGYALFSIGLLRLTLAIIHL